MPLEITPHKKLLENQVKLEQISEPPTPEPTNLIMSRKVLRKVQRKASSSVCSVQ